MSTSNIGDPFSKYEKGGEFGVNYVSKNDLKGISGNNEYRVLIYNLSFLYKDKIFYKENLLYTYIAYAFENDELLFFGFPEDFLKSDDTKINKIGENLAVLIRAAEENK